MKDIVNFKMSPLEEKKEYDIHFIDDANSRLWYKGWGCIIDNTLFVGRYNTIRSYAKKNSTEYFSLGQGVYTTNKKRTTICFENIIKDSLSESNVHWDMMEKAL